MHRKVIALVFLLAGSQGAAAQGGFYGHSAPTIPKDEALKDWQNCVVESVVSLDDRTSPVMDVATAIEPLCMIKEDLAIDAVNKQLFDDHPALSAGIDLAKMEQLRNEAHTSFRRNIGTVILEWRSRKAR